MISYAICYLVSEGGKTKKNITPMKEMKLYFKVLPHLMEIFAFPSFHVEDVLYCNSAPRTLTTKTLIV